MEKFKRKACPPIKDKRPKGLKSIPALGYELLRIEARYLEEMPPVDTILKELREENDYEASGRHTHLNGAEIEPLDVITAAVARTKT